MQVGDKVLVTTDNWFFAPDGETYRAVWGTVRRCATAEATLGIRPNGRSTNWYLEVGNMVVAGCQIHYVVRCDSFNPEPPTVEGCHEGQQVVGKAPFTRIYNADEPCT